MQPGLIFLIIGVTFLLACAILPWPLLARWRRRRGDAMATLAREQGWELLDTDESLPDRFHGFPFSTGRNPTVSNVLRGRSRGRSFVAFDYRVTLGGGVTSAEGVSGRTIMTFSVVAVDLDAPRPTLSVARRRRLDQLTNPFRVPKVEIGHRAFDEGFVVRSQDSKAARQAITPAVADLMLAHPGKLEGADWRLDGDAVVSVAQVTFTKPVDVAARLALLNDLLDLLSPGASSAR